MVNLGFEFVSDFDIKISEFLGYKAIAVRWKSLTGSTSL